MTRPFAWLAIAALLLAAGWYLFSLGETAPTPSDTDDHSPQATIGAQAADGNANAAAIQRTTASLATTPTTDGEATTKEHTFRVVGRCVLASDHSALSECTVQLRMETDAISKKALWPTPDHIAKQSDSSGTFALATNHDDWTDTIAVRIAKPGYVPRIARWPQPSAGIEVDLGDVPMLRAIQVTGTVVDQSGVAVEDAGMLFAYIEMTGKHIASSESMLRARSDAAGRFAFDLPAHSGEWYIGAENTGALVEPRSVKLADEGTFQVHVVVERPDPTQNITGTVVDTAGQAIPGLRVSASGEGFMGRGRTDDDGHFTVQRAGPIPDKGKSGTLLSVDDPNANYERVSPIYGTRIPWGKHGVRVVMRERAGRTIRVVDQEGQAVEAYTLFAFRGKKRLSIYKSKTQRGNHPDGRCRLTGLQTFPHSIVVLPRNRAHASTPAIAFEVEPLAKANELLVTLAAPVPTSVRVVDANGMPMASSTVELLQSFHDEPPTARSPAIALRECDRQRLTPEYVVLNTATTDAGGVAHLQAPPGSWHVRITGNDHVPQVQALHVGLPTTHIQVSVQAAAIVFGQVQPESALAQLREHSKQGKQPVVVLLTPDGGKALPPVPLLEDGTFSRGGLPTGLYQVSLRYWLRTGSVRADNVTLSVAEVQAHAGQQSPVTIDAAALLPGTVQGRIVAGGKPLSDVHCFLRRNGPGPFAMLRIATDGDGRFTGVVPAGEYGFSMTYPAQPGPGWLSIVLPDTWVLAPKQTHTIDFDVLLRRVRLRLLDQQQQPHVGLRIKVAHKGYFIPGGLKTDAEGFVEIYPAPLQAFHVDVTIDGKTQKLGPFDLPAGATTGTIVGHSN